jgi:hypothetical protein
MNSLQRGCAERGTVSVVASLSTMHALALQE